ncbi:MAG: GH36-type glycosyl hydrolase domain-containing protein [Planctomycetota bacterium]|jgi:cellobiose phosphorylase
MFRSEFGRFTADGREYVTTRTDTPRPWLNYLTNDVYGVCLSQNGFGYSFYRAAMDVRVTYIDIFGYVPTHPQTGKFVYLHDVKSKESWSLAPLSAGDPHKDFLCRHGLGYQVISAVNRGIAAELAVFVPRRDPVEVWEIRLRNTTRRTRQVRFFPYVEPSMHCASSMTDVLTYTRGRFERKLGAAVMRMTNSTSPFTYDAFMCGDYRVTGHDCRRESFLGTGHTILDPQAPARGRCTGSPVSAEQMCLVVSGQMTLRPGEEKTAHVIVGVSHSDAQVRRLKKKYAARGAWERELSRVQKYWNRVLASPSVKSPSKLFDLQMNAWTKYQSHFTSRWVRGGDKGYRDVLQDVMGYCAVDPGWCGHWLVESLKNMFSSGLCPRQYSHYGAGDDLRLHRDSPMWLPLVLDEYLRETGDFKLLKRRIPYRDSGSGTVWEHVLCGLDRLYRERGRDGLCMIGDGDWNDSLDEVALEGKGRTAWLTIATVYAMRVARRIAGAAGDSRAARKLARRIAEMDRAANRVAWDGDWYIYAIDDRGRKIGSRKNREGKIHLNCQTWAVFAGVARGERLKKVLRTVDRRMATKYGPVLMHRCDTGYRKGIGKVSAKNPGMAENAPMYMHGAAFKMLADCYLGRGEEAFDTYERVLPQSPHSSARHHGGEPFASHRYLIGPGCPEREGQSAYPWFCAWQAWAMIVGHQWIAGVRPSYRELLIDPCVPKKWRKLTVTRRWRGTTYEIEIRNPRGVQSGVTELYLDGRRLEGNAVPAPRKAGGRRRVLAVMGPDGARPELF